VTVCESVFSPRAVLEMFIFTGFTGCVCTYTSLNIVLHDVNRIPIIPVNWEGSLLISGYPLISVELSDSSVSV